MRLKFSKMQGAGNDFIVIDAINQEINFSAAQWQRLADRRFGIGADQILVVQAAETADTDFRYRIFNADGGEVEQCGNGSRAFVKFVWSKGLTSKRAIRVQTMKGVIEPQLEDDGSVSVNMGAPILHPRDVPFDSAGLVSRIEHQAQVWPLQIAGQEIEIVVVSMGNPHAVQIVADVENAAVLSSGPQIEHHPRFPARVNAGFMQIIDPHQIALRVFERGAGETLACGTGSCAAVVSGILRGVLQSPVQVNARGGVLHISWQGLGSDVIMRGPAEFVFDGEIEVD